MTDIKTIKRLGQSICVVADAMCKDVERYPKDIRIKDHPHNIETIPIYLIYYNFLKEGLEGLIAEGIATVIMPTNYAILKLNGVKYFSLKSVKENIDRLIDQIERLAEELKQKGESIEELTGEGITFHTKKAKEKCEKVQREINPYQKEEKEEQKRAAWREFKDVMGIVEIKDGDIVVD